MSGKKSILSTQAGRANNAGKTLTHLDAKGQLRMVDVGAKPITHREAIARCAVKMAPATLDAIIRGQLKKGEVLVAARIAGIMAAKKTWELIPLCHQIPLSSIEIKFTPNRQQSIIEIESRAVTEARTGVEMEAMVAVSTAALTIYDMAKAIDRAMVIHAIRLVAKSGGRSGDFIRGGEHVPPSKR